MPAFTESIIFVSSLRNICSAFLGICSVCSLLLRLFVSYFASIVSIRSLSVQYLMPIKMISEH